MDLKGIREVKAETSEAWSEAGYEKMWLIRLELDKSQK